MIGPITATRIFNGGRNYAVGDTGNLVQVFNATATYRVTKVNADQNGYIAAFVVTDGGSGYDSNDSIELPTSTGGTQPGIGDLFTYDLESVTPVSPICGGLIVNWTGSLGGEGSGYQVGDLLLVTNPALGGEQAVFVVLALDPFSPGGTGVALSGGVSFGTGYTVTNGVSTTALTGGGSGFQIDIAEVSPIVPCPQPAPPSPATYWNPGSSLSLLCEKNYPWTIPPKDRTPVQIRNSIPAPAANVLTELWAYTVPDGFWFAYDLLLFFAKVSGFEEGSGSIIFTLDVNTPTTGPALPVGRPLAKFTTNVGELSEPVQVAPVQLFQGDIIRAKVNITDPTLGVGLPNIITAALEGWLFPHSRL